MLFDNWRRFYGIAVSGLPYFTLTKLANAIRCVSEKWRRTVRFERCPM